MDGKNEPREKTREPDGEQERRADGDARPVQKRQKRHRHEKRQPEQGAPRGNAAHLREIRLIRKHLERTNPRRLRHRQKGSRHGGAQRKRKRAEQGRGTRLHGAGDFGGFAQPEEDLREAFLADEIDIVLSVGQFLSGDYETMCDEIEEIKSTCGDHHLKVILETGALGSMSNVMKASVLAMYSGADFIKTSTGKLDPAATPEAAYVMCNAIKEYHARTGRKVGFKPAGGINTVADAVAYYTIVKEILGNEWLTPELFRLGTSRLANLLLSEIVGEETKFF